MWRLIPITALSPVPKTIGRYTAAMKDAILVVGVIPEGLLAGGVQLPADQGR